MTTVTTTTTMIDGDRIGHTDGTLGMRRRMRRNDVRKRFNASVRKTESAMLGRNDTGTKRTRSRADSSTTLTTMTAVACHIGHTATESGSGRGRKFP